MKISSIRRLSGFSLIEMSMVLLVVGIIASLTLPVLTTTLTLQRQKTTESNKEILFKALAVYVLTNDSLPRPSLPTLQGRSKPRATVGIIPYQELGIPESMARDGYGNWFTYAINSNLAHEQNLSQPAGGISFSAREQGTALNLKSLEGVAAFTSTQRREKDFIAVILISHGPKGTGAFLPDNDERRSAFHAKEAENSNDGTTFYFKSSLENDPDFNHKVYWVTRNNLMAIYANKSFGTESSNASASGRGDNSNAPFSRPAPPPSLRNEGRTNANALLERN